MFSRERRLGGCPLQCVACLLSWVHSCYCFYQKQRIFLCQTRSKKWTFTKKKMYNNKIINFASFLIIFYYFPFIWMSESCLKLQVIKNFIIPLFSLIKKYSSFLETWEKTATKKTVIWKWSIEFYRSIKFRVILCQHKSLNFTVANLLQY